MRYTVKQNHTSSETISLHPIDLGKLSLYENQMLTLRIGAIEKKVKITNHEEKPATIYISSDVLDHFSLPENLEYEIKSEPNSLSIGPIIGLLIRGKKEELTKQRIKIYKNYLIDYLHINGLVLLFTTDGMNVDERTVEGFAFDPGENEWKRGVFPFPSAIFLRKTIRQTTHQQLEALVGPNYFNSHVFNKWEMWEWFSAHPLLKKYVAETVLADNLEDMKGLLSRHDTIYIKPISGMQGTGIYQLGRIGEEYELSYRLNGKNVVSLFETWRAVAYFLSSELNLDKYMGQERIPLLKSKGRVMDFRVIVVKDQNGNWTVPGIVTRFGEKDSIVSNISNGGEAEKGWETIRKIYKKDQKNAFMKYKEMEELALQCCKVLEKRGFHFGYIGIDIGLDEEKNLWVIEINNRSPDMTIALDADDSQLYYKIKAAPLRYAKWLAGFRGGN